MRAINIVDTPQKCEELLERLWKTPHPVGVDTETVGINPRKEAPACSEGQIVCWSLSVEGSQEFLWADVLPCFQPWLESARPKVGHNIFSFDLHMFRNHGIDLNGIVGDTLRMHKLLHPDNTMKHDLKTLGKYWLGYKQLKFDQLFTRPKHEVVHVQETTIRSEPTLYRHTKRKVGEQRGVPTLFMSGLRGKFGKGRELIPLDQIPESYPERLPALYNYATLDAKITFELYFKFKERLRETAWEV